MGEEKTVHNAGEKHTQTSTKLLRNRITVCVRAYAPLTATKHTTTLVTIK